MPDGLVTGLNKERSTRQGDLKFRSSITLFARDQPADGCFEAALQKYFDGEQDPVTLARI